MSYISFYIFLKQVEHKNIIIGFFLIAALILILSLLSPTRVGAQYYSQSDLKKIVTIDKKIRLPKEDTILDNVPSTKYVFVDGDVIEFEIVVTNVGNEDLTDLKLSDVLPKYLSLVFCPGSLDKNSNTINWSLDRLVAGESRKYLIRAKISNIESANTIQTVKLTNKTYVVTGDINDKDFATYFVAKKMVPSTGDNSLPVKTLVLASVGISALFLRKLARGF